jgi:hypothetical protein
MEIYGNLWKFMEADGKPFEAYGSLMEAFGIISDGRAPLPTGLPSG